MTARSLAWTAAAMAALAPLAARADSLSCGGGIVSIGDSKVDLLGKCGRPALEERSEEVARADVTHGAGRRVGAPVERWTYANQLLRFVRLENGKVTDVETGSYGYAK